MIERTGQSRHRQSLLARALALFARRALLIGLMTFPAAQQVCAQPREPSPAAVQPLQDPSDPSPAIDLAGTGIMDDISDRVFISFSTAKELPPAALPSLSFSQGTRKYSQFIPPALVNSIPVMKFTLVNSSDSVQRVFFCPGFLFRSIRIFNMKDS